MKRSILAATAFALVAAAALCGQQRPRTRLAYIGLELDGSWSFLKQAQEEPEAELVAVADPHPDLLERAKGATPPGTRLYANYVKMLDEVRPNAVLVTKSNDEHLPVVEACAKRKVHVWFQMPMARTAAEARKMEKLANDAGILLMINFWTLWEPSMQSLAASLLNGDIGPVQRLSMRHAWSASKGLSRYYAASFLDPERHGGGALMNQGQYGINFAVWMMGRPERVFATVKHLRDIPGSSREDESLVIMDYPKGTATISSGWWALPDTGPGFGEASLAGPKGILRRNLGIVTLQRGRSLDGTIVGDPEPKPAVVPSISRERRNGVAHFVDCIRTGKPIEAPHTGALNVTVAEVIDAAYESARTGRVVTLPPK